MELGDGFGGMCSVQGAAPLRPATEAEKLAQAARRRRDEICSAVSDG